MALLVQDGKLPIDGAIVMVIGMLMDSPFGAGDGDGCHPFGAAALWQWYRAYCNRVSLVQLCSGVHCNTIQPVPLPAAAVAVEVIVCALQGQTRHPIPQGVLKPGEVKWGAL